MPPVSIISCFLQRPCKEDPEGPEVNWVKSEGPPPRLEGLDPWGRGTDKATVISTASMRVDPRWSFVYHSLIDFVIFMRIIVNHICRNRHATEDLSALQWKKLCFLHQRKAHKSRFRHHPLEPEMGSKLSWSHTKKEEPSNNPCKASNLSYLTIIQKQFFYKQNNSFLFCSHWWLAVTARYGGYDPGYDPGLKWFPTEKW